MALRVLSVICLLLAPCLAIAEERDIASLTRLDTDDPEQFEFFQALGIYDFTAIRVDGHATAAQVIREFDFPGVAPEVWRNEVREIFDPRLVFETFEAAWNEAPLAPDSRMAVQNFFTSELGQRIVAAELTASEEMSGPVGAERAIAAAEQAQSENDPRLAALNGFIAENGLVEFATAALLGARFQYFRGLSDGGALQPPVPEDDFRRYYDYYVSAETEYMEDWHRAYALLAYGDFSPEDFAAYRAFQQTAEADQLEDALSSAFDGIPEAMHYQLGRAAARYSTANTP